MKKLIIILLIVIGTGKLSISQNINWNNLENQKPNMFYLNLGYDFSLSTQIGYARSIKSFRPILLTIDQSFPTGDNLFDDFKFRMGAHIELIEINDFNLSAKILGVFRRYETEMVKMSNFGAEMSATAGYYRPKWHIAGEFGFDKSVITHLKHTDLMRDNFSEIQDGWYIPSGGQFYYGLQIGKTIGKSINISARAGLTNAQRDDQDAPIPYYGQIGISKSF